MKVEPLEVYSTATNLAVIKPPGRGFPGSVIQGDTLSSLVSNARELAIALRSAGVKDEQLLGEAEALLESLLSRLLHYQAVLDEHGIELPYAPRVAEQDMVHLTS